MAERLSPTNTGIALLVNIVAIVAILYVLIALFAHRSGAHFNPVVTGVFWLKREITTSLAIGYVLVQIFGAIGGVWLANVMFDLPLLQISTHVRTGMTGDN
jgi:glycerol uptake facilitator-like aquaporin